MGRQCAASLWMIDVQLLQGRKENCRIPDGRNCRCSIADKRDKFRYLLQQFRLGFKTAAVGNADKLAAIQLPYGRQQLAGIKAAVIVGYGQCLFCQISSLPVSKCIYCRDSISRPYRGLGKWPGRECDDQD